MKHDQTLRVMRDADFVNCCRMLLRSGRFSGATAANLAARAEKMSPRAYYVSFDHAYRQLTRFRARGSFSVVGRNAREMWYALLRDVERLQRRRKLPLSDALSIALVDCRPPRFFISPSTATHILRTATN